MFVHDKEAGWKERGAGMLKINVPTQCVDFDDAGAVIPGSFDASSLEDDSSESPKVVRLLMRQDQTHRVILNTPVLPAIKFQEKASLKSVAILFTAFQGEDAKPTSVTMRVSRDDFPVQLSIQSLTEPLDVRSQRQDVPERDKRDSKRAPGQLGEVPEPLSA